LLANFSQIGDIRSISMMKGSVTLIFLISSLSFGNCFKLPKFEFLKDTIQAQKFVKSKLLPLVVGASILVQAPSDVDALPSGSRGGGSSFRSSTRSSTSYGSSRSSTAFGSSRSSFAAPTTNYYVTPSPSFYAPSPFFSPFGFFRPYIPIPIDFSFLLLLGGVAFILSRRAGGSDFSMSEDSGALGDGASLVKLTLAVDSDWNNRNNIMNTLARLASQNEGQLGSRKSLANFLSEISLALLRQQGDWVASAYDSESYNERESRKVGELFFDARGIVHD
jgi:uncharacterized membrane protein